MESVERCLLGRFLGLRGGTYLEYFIVESRVLDLEKFFFYLRQFFCSTDAIMPMIPLGLKETKEIDFRDPFKDFILEHYSEDANKYENAIADFMDTRQVLSRRKHFKHLIYACFSTILGHENAS